MLLANVVFEYQSLLNGLYTINRINLNKYFEFNAVKLIQLGFDYTQPDVTLSGVEG